MRRFFIFVFMVYAASACAQSNHSMQQDSTDTFVVTHDTVRIDAKAFTDPLSTLSLRKAVKLHGFYYVLLSENSIYFSEDSNHFLRISTDFSKIEYLEYPQKLSSPYDDLFVRHDTLFIHDYYGLDHHYFFNENTLKWDSIPWLSDQLYEDDDYKVYYIDNGEFGDYSWFEDKHSGKQYLFPTNLERINRIGSSFYLTTAGSIRKLDNPAAGIPCDENIQYNNGIHDKDLYSIAIQMNKGPNHDIHRCNDAFQTILEYRWAEQGWWDMASYKDNLFEGAFQFKGSLYTIVRDPQHSYIARLDNNRLTLVKDLTECYDLFQYSNCYRGKNSSESSFLKPFSRSNNEYGIIDIDGNQVHIVHIFHNQDSLPYLGKDFFEETFSYVYNHLESLHYRDVLAFEQSLCAPFKTTRMAGRNAYFQKELNVPKNYEMEIFTKVIDSILTIHTWYCYSLSDSLVKGVFFEWEKTKNYTPISWKIDESRSKQAEFKYPLIYQELTSFFNTETELKGSPSKNCIQWKTKPYRLEMYKPDYNLRILLELREPGD